MHGACSPRVRGTNRDLLLRPDVLGFGRVRLQCGRLRSLPVLRLWHITRLSVAGAFPCTNHHHHDQHVIARACHILHTKILLIYNTLLGTRAANTPGCPRIGTPRPSHRASVIVVT